MKLKMFNLINRNQDSLGGFGENTPSIENRMKTVFASQLKEVDSNDDEPFTPEQLALQAEKRKELEDGKKAELEAAEANKKKLLEQKKLEEGEERNKKSLTKDDEDSNQHAVSYLMTKYGYTTDELKEAFADLNLDSDDIDDIDKFYQVRENIVKQQAIEEFLSKNEDLKDLSNHLSEGRSLDTWRQKREAFNWKGFEIKEDDVETQEKVYSYLLKQRGLDDDEINDQVEIAKDKRTLFAKSVDAQNKLDSEEKNRIKAIEIKELQEIENNKKEEAKTIKQVTDIIMSGNINGYIIPEKNRKETLNFIMSGEREAKYNRLPLEAKILLDEIVRGYDEKEGRFTIKGLDAAKNNKKPEITLKGKKPKLDSDDSDLSSGILTLSEFSKRKPQFNTFD